MKVKSKLKPIVKEEMPLYRQLNMERKTNETIIIHLENKLKQSEEERQELLKQNYEVQLQLADNQAETDYMKVYKNYDFETLSPELSKFDLIKGQKDQSSLK